MSYTRNFGFRDYTGIIRDGRNSVPGTLAAGPDVSGYQIGTAVTVAPDGSGTLIRPAVDAPPTALSGIVVYEHIQFQGVDPFLTTQYDFPFTVAPLGRYAQMVHGPGVKVWLRNTAALPLYDGRTQLGFTIVTSTLTGVTVGSYLGVDANGTWKTEASAAAAWLQVEYCNPTTGLVEARFTF